MRRRPERATPRRWIAALLVSTLALAGCAGASSPSPPPVATSYVEFHEALCLAWDSLFAAVGNPDTGEGSALSKGLEQAIEVRDLDRADRLALEMRGEIAEGRGWIAVAAGWAPAAPLAVPMDRLFSAMDASIEARRAAASDGLQVASEKAQGALEAAGGLEAWRAIMTPETWQAIGAARPPGTEAQACPNVPISF